MLERSCSACDRASTPSTSGTSPDWMRSEASPPIIRRSRSGSPYHKPDMISYRSIATLCGAVLLACCGEDAVQQIAAPPTSAAPRMNFYDTDHKLTAINTTIGAESTTEPLTSAAGARELYSQV